VHPRFTTSETVHLVDVDPASLLAAITGQRAFDQLFAWLAQAAARQGATRVA